MSKGEFNRDAIAAGSDCQTLPQPHNDADASAKSH